MGQHKHNPTAIAAARGELSKADRKPAKKIGGGTFRSVLDIVLLGGVRPYFEDAHGSIRHRVPRVKGKAAVKAAKRARHAQRKLAA